MTPISGHALNGWLFAMNLSPRREHNLCSAEARKVIVAGGWKMGIGWQHFDEQTEAGLWLDRKEVWFGNGFLRSTTKHELSHAWLFSGGLTREEILAVCWETWKAAEAGDAIAENIAYWKARVRYAEWETLYNRVGKNRALTEDTMAVKLRDLHPDRCGINFWEIFACWLSWAGRVPEPLWPLFSRFLHPKDCIWLKEGR